MAERTEQEQLLARIEGLIDSKDLDGLRAVLAESRSSDIAEVVEVLDEADRQILFDLLDPEDAGEVIEKVDEATRSEVVEGLTNDELSTMLSTLPPDEAADLVGELTPQQTEQVLERLAGPESDQLAELLKYDQDSAGGIMTPVLVKVELADTIAKALDHIRASDPDEDFICVFVVDGSGRFKGVVQLKTLLHREPTTPISEVLEDEVPVVTAQADQEEVANTFRKYDLMVAPVVDADGLLLGRITADDILDVIDDEAEEDVLVMAGTHPAELDTHRSFRAAGIRLPWLLTCLVGSMVSALVIYFFGSYFTTEQWLSITMFVPAIAAMGGNSGLQTSTIVVRGLATGHLAAFNLIQVFVRESRVALIVAVACGLTAGLLATAVLTFRSAATPASSVPLLGLGVGLAMFFAIMLATSLGLVLPFMFRRIGIDPAISSGPLVTTANDMLSYAAYFTVSLLLLRLFSG